MSIYHLAQINIGRLRPPIDDPLIADVADALGTVNAIADTSRGFVWRLQTDEGSATAIQATDDPLLLINLSVWETADELPEYGYRSEHVDLIQKRSEWFEGMAEPHMCLRWVPAGEVPTPQEGLRRLQQLRRDGPTRVP